MDLRERVAAACDSGELTREQIARQFSVSTTFIRRLLARREATGSVSPRPRAGGFESAVDGHARDTLRELARQQPDATLKELRGRLAERGGPRVCVSRVCQVLAELKLPRKKTRAAKLI